MLDIAFAELAARAQKQLRVRLVGVDLAQHHLGVGPGQFGLNFKHDRSPSEHCHAPSYGFNRYSPAR
ncbi:MAG: hypothetical protein Q8M09_04815 [Pseudomonadota bacterium]|nr:hypothetical protein [Pseudomonadota bacterium]MDP2351406.1 hypothetical protein [Pseudomonadota bacterium]